MSMQSDLDAMNELHWLIDMVQTIEVGLVVLDKNFNIQLWNGFMENHSGVSPNDIKGDNLFQRFPDLPEQWLKQKMESVFLLKSQAFISWEQRPYVFKFKNYRPITGRAEFMYQNITLLPLASLTGQINNISMIIYDVTDMAVNKMQLEATGDKLQLHTQTDGLTHLLNRRYWLQQAMQQYERFEQYRDPVTMMMINIDHLKQLNESAGHVAGDRAIQHVAHILKKHLRETDIGGRFGGETLGVVLCNTEAAEALNQAERIRNDVANAEFSYANQKIKVTVSIGVYQLNKELGSPDKWLDKVDEALALAKVSGRNCVQLLQPDE